MKVKEYLKSKKFKRDLKIAMEFLKAALKVMITISDIVLSILWAIIKKAWKVWEFIIFKLPMILLFGFCFGILPGVAKNGRGSMKKR